MSKLSIVIIGSSIAALSAAEAARRQDPEAQLTLLSEDAYFPYYRQRLCEVLEDPENAAKLYLHPQGWYAEQGFDLRLLSKVTAVLPDEKRLRLADGKTLPYDRLILATGSYSFIPPTKGSELDGVETLWTMADALRIEKRLARVKTAIVVGGGLLGLEAAYALERRGIKTSILERAPRLMMRQLDERAAELFTARVEQEGAEVNTNAIIQEIYAGAPGKVGGVRLEDGSDFPADLLIVSAGVRARLDALGDAGLEAERCITVDECMRTNVPDIYAAGDCVCFDKRWYGLWSIAKAQGEVAGANAAGGDRHYVMPVPPYMVNTMGTRIASAGMIEESQLGSAEAERLHADIEEKVELFQYAKKIYCGDKLCGFVLLGDTKAFGALNKELG